MDMVGQGRGGMLEHTLTENKVSLMSFSPLQVVSSRSCILILRPLFRETESKLKLAKNVSSDAAVVLQAHANSLLALYVLAMLDWLSYFFVIVTRNSFLVCSVESGSSWLPALDHVCWCLSCNAVYHKYYLHAQHTQCCGCNGQPFIYVK